MKRFCTRCFREFDEDENGPNPAEALGQILAAPADDPCAGDICRRCREELGILSLFGFGGDDFG